MAVKLYTGMVRGTLEEATKAANEATKDTGIYYTAVKSRPIGLFDLERVWVITNRFSPEVAK